jgi:DNA-binding transcriptional LysR family regulator
MRGKSKRIKMELRHLRCFMAVAEELHFARAAERLHIEQSPLSRTIRELEDDLGTQLFLRTTRSTRLTRAGEMLFKHVPRVFAALEQARDSVLAISNGFHDQLRIAVSDCSARLRLPALLALCRQEDPEVELRLFEVPLSQQVEGLQDGRYDVGFSLSNDVGDGISAHPIWSEPLVVAVPARHPLLAYSQIPLGELLRYPLVLCDPEACEGHSRLVDRVLRRVDQEPLVADRVASFELMMTLVSAGLALGLAGESHILASRETGVVARPLAERVPAVTTYLLHLDTEPSQTIARFIMRAGAVGPPVLNRHTDSSHPDTSLDV